ncbi:MAG: class F sortase [Nocardioides sp.]
MTALLGILLSLVTLASSPDGPEPVVEVRGPAAVDSEPTPRPPEAPEPRGVRVGRTSTAVPVSAGEAPQPMLLRAPTIGVWAEVVGVGVAGDQQMQLPEDPRRLGWYRYGPAPGDGRGSAVLAGHVDSATYGVGPLARLGELRPGDPVAVRLDSGAWHRFRVDSLESFDRQRLPATVFNRDGAERLRLITCTGAYVRELGGYQENLVVTAVPSEG